MAATVVGIVYSKNQQVIRRIIHFDDDSQIPAHRKVANGEIFVTIPIADYNAISDHQTIHDYLGLKGIAYITDRHAVVDNLGNVVAVVAADPAIDTHPAGKLIQHPTAIPGDTIINGVFTAIASAVISSSPAPAPAPSSGAAS